MSARTSSLCVGVLTLLVGACGSSSPADATTTPPPSNVSHAQPTPAQAETPAPVDATPAPTPPAAPAPAPDRSPPTAENIPDAIVPAPTGTCRCVDGGAGWVQAGAGGTAYTFDYAALCDLDAQLQALLAASSDTRVELPAARRAQLARTVASARCVLSDEDARLGPFEHSNGGEATLNFMIHPATSITWLAAEWNGARWVATRVWTQQLHPR